MNLFSSKIFQFEIFRTSVLNDFQERPEVPQNQMKIIILCIFAVSLIIIVTSFTMRQKLKSVSKAFEPIVEVLAATEQEVSVFNFDGNKSFLEDGIVRCLSKTNVPYSLTNFKIPKSNEVFDMTQSSIMSFYSPASMKMKRKTKVS